MQESFEKFWRTEYAGVIDSGQPQALIAAWREVAWKAFVAGYKAATPQTKDD